MALQAHLMGAGTPPEAAKQIAGDVLTAGTATGTTQATALELYHVLNRLSTVASGSGVKLYRGAVKGDSQTVYNDGANALLVYPQLGENIAGLSVNVAISVPAGQLFKFQKFGDTTWATGIVNTTGAFTNVTISGTLAVSGASTFAAGSFTTLATSGNATLGDAVTDSHAVNGLLTMTGPSANGQVFIANSTHASGSYSTWQRSGVSKGDVGVGAQIVSGGDVDAFGIASRGTLLLCASSATVATLTSSGMAVTGTLSASGLITASAGITSTGSTRAFINPTLGAGTYSLQVEGVAGAARDLLLVGHAGFSNGFTITSTGSVMSYTFIDGPVTASTSVITPIVDSGSGTLILKGATTTAVTITGANAVFAGSITTGAPAGGTAAAWKFGAVASVTPTVQNRTIELDVGGTIYYLTAKTTNN